MGLLGILVGLAILVWLAFRGWSVLLLAPAAALVAATFGGQPLLASWTQIFMESAARRRRHGNGRAPAVLQGATCAIHRLAAIKYLGLINPSNKLMRELRKRIVARAHNHNAIATTGQSDKGVTAGASIRKCKSLYSAPFNLTYDFTTSNAAIDSAAEIDRLGHGQNVLIVQLTHKTVHQGVLHQANRAIAMGLKHRGIL